MRVKWITHNGQTVYHKPKKDYVMLCTYSFSGYCPLKYSISTLMNYKFNDMSPCQKIKLLAFLALYFINILFQSCVYKAVCVQVKVALSKIKVKS